ncbi:helix-turn-helix domain-containing protein [Fictibacillus enclensis]|uniref:helix-turn-helix domain-containing protein n=1 Tax=Fictibacillus enclensis TaxID=1017270 RepID=UPI003D30F7B4
MVIKQLESARKRGKKRRPAIGKIQRLQITKLFKSGESAVDIGRDYGISRSTVYKVLNQTSSD